MNELSGIQQLTDLEIDQVSGGLFKEIWGWLTGTYRPAVLGATRAVWNWVGESGAGFAGGF